MTLRELPVLLVGTALLGAYVIPITNIWREKWGPWVALATTAVCAAGAIVLAWAVALGGPIGHSLGGWPIPWGIEVRVDGPAAFMLVTVTVVSLASLVYAARGLQFEAGPKATGWFWTLTLLLMGAMMGIVIAQDLFNMFVFVEIASLAACGIVSIKGGGKALESTLRYLILSALGTGALLFAVALTYMATGHLNMGYVVQMVPEALVKYPGNIYAGLGFMTVGFGVKAALFPLHTWLPDAHSDAPTPSSAILSGLVVKVFAFGYWRVLTEALGPVLEQVPVGLVVAMLGALAGVAGSILAAVQGDLKRLLAYSTVAQMGAIFIGFGLGGDLSVTGALMHVMAHGMMKAGLFMSVGCIIYATGKRGIGDVAGLGRSMPWTMAAFLVMALSMVGIPPLAGFASKWYLVMGALEQGMPFFAVVLVFTSALTVLYLFPLLIRAYLSPSDGPQNIRVPFMMEAPSVILAILVIVLGLYPEIMFRLMGM